ncbi:conserved hypothetical protein [Neospora caninum Liverpool]|uniref:Transmembrane protein n=1 Tax=Neospora caninum (strain Liverpool) TaxID=572307 RepID=F0VE71_NEOCL|nr:conserved hypothetical protein [Neospora caninum Liverpool]CBZ52015.1 conserved hypothetical protein [Neospora caninum Liverpool]CEL65976.1 TPA: hypothetical protein BN1204_018050 [Neospora caninum Liverpool]|eukprot:XP_003882047.1 conserved hypothetical protein [Neospora caninum Liverpool]
MSLPQRDEAVTVGSLRMRQTTQLVAQSRSSATQFASSPAALASPALHFALLEISARSLADVALGRRQAPPPVPRGPASRASLPGGRLASLFGLCLVLFFSDTLPVSQPPVFVLAAADATSPSSSPSDAASRNLDRSVSGTQSGGNDRAPPSPVGAHLLEALSAYRRAEKKNELSAADREALLSLLREIEDVKNNVKQSLSQDSRGSAQEEHASVSRKRDSDGPDTHLPSAPDSPARQGRVSTRDEVPGVSEERRRWEREQEKERERARGGRSSFPAALVFISICVASLLVFVIVRLETKAMVRGGKRHKERSRGNGSKAREKEMSDESEGSDACEGGASPRSTRHRREEAERYGAFTGPSSSHGAVRRRRGHHPTREEHDVHDPRARATGCTYTSSTRFQYPANHKVSDVEEEPSLAVNDSERERGTSPSACESQRARDLGDATCSHAQRRRDAAPKDNGPANTSRGAEDAQSPGAPSGDQEPLAAQVDSAFAASARPLRASAQESEKQQAYEDLCTRLFGRLAALVPEDRPGPKHGPASPAETRGDTSTQEGAWKGEAEKTEAGEILTSLERMLKDIEDDFSTNRAAHVTCMIRCCNTLLRLDGLTLLSRCRKEDSLREKAQKVIETVVPCIWSS